MSAARRSDSALLTATEPGRRNRRTIDSICFAGAAIVLGLTAVIAKNAPKTDEDVAHSLMTLLGWAGALWRTVFVATARPHADHRRSTCSSKAVGPGARSPCRGTRPHRNRRDSRSGRDVRLVAGRAPRPVALGLPGAQACRCDGGDRRRWPGARSPGSRACDVRSSRLRRWAPSCSARRSLRQPSALWRSGWRAAP